MFFRRFLAEPQPIGEKSDEKSASESVEIVENRPPVHRTNPGLSGFEPRFRSDFFAFSGRFSPDPGCFYLSVRPPPMENGREKRKNRSPVGRNFPALPARSGPS